MRVYKFRKAAKIITKVKNFNIPLEDLPEVIDKLTKVYCDSAVEVLVKEASETIAGRALEIFTGHLKAMCVYDLQRMLKDIDQLEVKGEEDILQSES